MADRVVGRLEVHERADQRLGHVAAAEVALHPPPAAAIDLEQARVHRRGPERDVRPVAAGVARPLHEQRDEERILARTLANDPRSLHAGRDIDAHRGHGEHRLAHVRRVQATRQRDRHLAGDGRGEGRVDPDPGAARMRPAGGVEQDPAGTGVEERAGAPDHVVGHGVRPDTQGLPHRASDRGHGRRAAHRR